ncbi:16S rRNA (adenine(1518)-N(6)/adenine(1519)-N(6))-dimethyltransferase RsmA [Roseimaritima ulvae]|uniref:Ribosomal RNA small subunit methyltransferase A n=1 Tax=Roseimaritima ulvae TaxID=980254 RepID=A0A5B9R1P4_9BACT|nr:16S rRNA (adenine(1518)-N(6)/adenine(1519)-N(6))-dimethyltransferase RsmA [Roseimaritima ulvae]QEG40253.1 Ribosomal RNA adenine dimethylase [Roseimaritima ulvae]
MAERQTATYLNERFIAAGLRPLTRFGQNFLIDLNLLDLIARSAEMQKTDVVLEVGTGMGSLTTRLAEAAGAIVTVEIDDNLAELSQAELEQYPHVLQLHCDALKNKHTLAPELMDNVRKALQSLGESARFMLVANLPYNIATPLISNLLAGDPPPDRMVVTIQKEMADRLVAAPGSKDYGALSVWVQSQCAVEIVRVMPPQVFWPRPKIDSAIVRIDLQPERRAAIADLKFFHETVRALFFHRRKLLRSVTCSAFKGRLSKPEVDQTLQAAGYSGTERTEQLTVDQIIELCEHLRQAVS